MGRKNILSLKQLYGYSYMKWNEIYKKIELFLTSEPCSFCRESEKRITMSEYDDCSGCEECLIDPRICATGSTDTAYDMVWNARCELLDSLHHLCLQLRTQYYKRKDE